jgi:hypothetical protein
MQLISERFSVRLCIERYRLDNASTAPEVEGIGVFLSCLLKNWDRHLADVVFTRFERFGSEPVPFFNGLSGRPPRRVRRVLRDDSQWQRRA